MSVPQLFEFTDPQQITLQGYKWVRCSKPKAVVQIAHGMAEHAARYGHFAEFLNQHDILVYAHDHRGHGKTAQRQGLRGYFADEDGWQRCVDDMFQLNTIIHTEHPMLPVFLLGHSMGSFLSRSFIQQHGGSIQACILSGTATHPGALLKSALLIARLQRLFNGRLHPSKLLDKLSFGRFNKNIQKPKTAFDWLSRDERTVASYVADPDCGFICTTGFFIDLFHGLQIINNIEAIRQAPPGLPVLFMAGSQDPVGEYGKGVRLAMRKFEEAGMKNLTLKIYEGGRHEMLNEINKTDVYRDLVQFIRTCL